MKTNSVIVGRKDRRLQSNSNLILEELVKIFPDVSFQIFPSSPSPESSFHFYTIRVISTEEALAEGSPIPLWSIVTLFKNYTQEHSAFIPDTAKTEYFNFTKIRSRIYRYQKEDY
ncbi:hypothetical protein J4405_01645 [Candidatus Woesearchaeota archaeon]|nr:hypothetical protein [Candidatus Woesearchaeota archaeon]